MGLFAVILGYALALLPTIVTGIQTVAGDAASGANKKQMAHDALAAALQGATSILPGGTTNSVLAQGAGAVAGGVIDATSAIHAVLNHVKKQDSVSTVVTLTRATGAYQQATDAFKTSQSASHDTSKAPAAQPAAALTK